MRQANGASSKKDKSTKSVPINFPPIKNNFQKKTSVSPEEEKLKEKLAKLTVEQEEVKATHKELSDECRYC